MKRASQASAQTKRDGGGLVPSKLVQPFFRQSQAAASLGPRSHTALRKTASCCCPFAPKNNKQAAKERNGTSAHTTPDEYGRASYADLTRSRALRVDSHGKRGAATARARAILRRAENSGCQSGESVQEAGASYAELAEGFVKGTLPPIGLAETVNVTRADASGVG